MRAYEGMIMSNFWTAFYAGLSAPVMLFGHQPGYSGYVQAPSAAQSFGTVGALLSTAVRGESIRR